MEENSSLEIINGLFKDIIEEPEETESDKLAAGEIIDLNTSGVVPDKPKRKKSNGVKKTGRKLSTIPQITGNYYLSKFNSDVIETCDITGIVILGEQINFTLSWHELLFTLIGTAISKETDVIQTLVDSGIVNDGVKVIYEIREYGLYEYDEYAFYKFPDTPYYLEVEKANSVAIFNSILNCLKYFEFGHTDVSVNLVNKEMMAQLEQDESAYEKLESKTKSLYSIIKDNEAVPHRIESIEYLGVTMSVNSLSNAIILLVTYFAATNDRDVVIEALKKSTIKDACGVIDEQFKYLGCLETVYIASVDLYLFQNGFVSDSIKFLGNLCKQLDIDTKSIKVNYKL